MPRRRIAAPPLFADAISEALGRGGREDLNRPKTGGPAGNARLTAWTGLALFALSLAELITLIDVRGLISWHVVIGTLLVPPAVLKTFSTGWRILRYYLHNADYVHAGPPPMLLRIVGPFVVVSTLGLLGTGLVLVFAGQGQRNATLFTAFGQRVDWLTLHQGFFIVWGAVTALHVLARTIPALQHTLIARTATDGSRWRAAALALTAVVAIVAAPLVLSAAGSWRGDGAHRGHREGFAVTKHSGGSAAQRR